MAFMVEEKVITWKVAVTLFILMTFEINLNDVKIFGG
jgi:hypothetical protein